VDEASPQSRLAYLLGVAETLRGIAAQLRYDLRCADQAARLWRGIMVWHGWETDPTLDPAATDVLAAYETAWEARKSTAECYRAGVEAWRRVHPEQTPVYSAQRAVAVILAAKVRLRIPDE
jgi:hypothetical protein